MKISTKGRYGLRALVDLAGHDNGEPIALASIAQRQKLSLNYLEQVFSVLRKAGIVKSLKGVNGGYRLAKKADDITVKEVLEVLEGKFSIVDEYAQEKGTDDVQEAIKTLVWDQINTRVNQLLEEKTLKQLMASFADEIWWRRLNARESLSVEGQSSNLQVEIPELDLRPLRHQRGIVQSLQCLRR